MEESHAIITTKRPPAPRAFTGLAGSPLAEITLEPAPESAPLSNAQRQAAYRARRAEQVRLKDAKRKARVRAPHPETLLGFNEKLAKRGLLVSGGIFIKNAPHGKGKLVSGGYDGRKFDEVIEAKGAALTGVVKPKGHEPDRSVDRNEHDWTLAPGSGVDPLATLFRQTIARGGDLDRSPAANPPKNSSGGVRSNRGFYATSRCEFPTAHRFPLFGHIAATVTHKIACFRGYLGVSRLTR